MPKESQIEKSVLLVMVSFLKNHFSKILLAWMLLFVALYFCLPFGGWEAFQLFQTQLALTRVMLVGIFVSIAFYYATHPQVFNNYFRERNTAYNLALFRLVFFGYFTISIALKPEGIQHFIYPWVHLPPESRTPLPLFGNMMFVIPFTESIMLALTKVWIVSFTLAFIGLFTRVASFTFTLLTFYLFGMSHYFGMVQHSQHFVWFGCLLAFSPCADVWSIDAWWKKRSFLKKEASKSVETKKPQYAVKYALPIRWAWLLLGVIYFIPGFWKIWDCGLDWALTDNLLNNMHLKWGQLDGWRPFFRIDHYPIVCKIGGVFVAALEFSFLFLIFHKKWRPILAVAAFSFHLFTVVFLHIDFLFLCLLYLFIIDWGILLDKTKGSFKKRWLAIRQDAFQSIPGVNVSLTRTFPKHKTLMLVGMLWFFANIAVGFAKIHTWPISSYPLFNHVTTGEYTYVSYTINDASSSLDKKTLNDYLYSYKLRAMENTIVYDLHANGDTLERNKRISQITDIIYELHKDEFAIDSILIAFEQRPINPDQQDVIFSSIPILTVRYNEGLREN